MSYPTSKLASFTLLETTIAMLLVAILGAFAYYAFGTFADLSRQEQLKKRDKYTVELLLYQLQRDWEQAESITYDNRQITLRDTLGMIRYDMTDSLILRHQYALRTDSFYVHAELPVVATVQRDSLSTDLVDGLTMNLIFEDKLIPVSLRKRYAAIQIMQFSPE